MRGNGRTILKVENLTHRFPIQYGFFRRTVGHVYAVTDVSFSVDRKRTLGVVGESGCGKTTLGKCLVRAIDPENGSIVYSVDDGSYDITTLDSRHLRLLRDHFQMIFQDPYSSLDPRMTVYDIIGEPLKLSGIRGEALEDRVREMTRLVGLEVKHLRRYPHAFSGGQRQRIGIARSLVLNPEFVVCDEPVSALDVSVQSAILNLLQDLQQKLSLTYLFISHDLSVVEHVADRVAVMYIGRIVEIAETEDLFLKPKHPYTEALLSAIPIPDPDAQQARIKLHGEVANPAALPIGCSFHPRCMYATDVCRSKEPELIELESGHFAACHRAREVELRGVPE